MTPTFYGVFLLALVGRSASVPQPLRVDACALICNPGAETESERERDASLYPRYPKVNCNLQSDSQEHQAWHIATHCLKLCNREFTVESEINCFALRSSLAASLGCYCEALTPLSPNTMRLHEDWRLNNLVKEVAKYILSTISNEPLDKHILCDIHKELFSDTVSLKSLGPLKECYKNATASTATPEPADQPIPEPLPTPQGFHMNKEPRLESMMRSLAEKTLLPEEEKPPITEENREEDESVSIEDGNDKETDERKKPFEFRGETAATMCPGCVLECEKYFKYLEFLKSEKNYEAPKVPNTWCDCEKVKKDCADYIKEEASEFNLHILRRLIESP